MAFSFNDLADAERHIALNDRHIETHRHLILLAHMSCRNSQQAEVLLEIFEGLQKDRLLHRARILRDLNC
jgi:hypothetical protein